MPRIAILVALAFCVLAFVACGGGDNNVPELGNGPAENVKGVWEGTYTSSAGPTGTFCLNLEQDGRSLSGAISFDGGGTTGVTGAIADTRMVFNWGQLAAASATSAVPSGIVGSGTFSGTVSAGTFDGTYSVTLTGDHGNWSGHRSDQRSCG